MEEQQAQRLLQLPLPYCIFFRSVRYILNNVQEAGALK